MRLDRVGPCEAGIDEPVRQFDRVADTPHPQFDRRAQQPSRRAQPRQEGRCGGDDNPDVAVGKGRQGPGA